MHTEEYRERLMECPDHNSPRFINYLRNNNIVVTENENWLLIENCKYNKEESRYYTAFLKSQTKYQDINVTLVFPQEWSSLFRLYQSHCDGWEIKIKKDKKKSIDRFHVHFIE